jgi:hypothetical protein
MCVDKICHDIFLSYPFLFINVCLPEHQVMNAIVSVQTKLHVFLTMVIDWVSSQLSSLALH